MNETLIPAISGYPRTQTVRTESYNYESLFPFVTKPSRYIGGEWNSVNKPEALKKDSVGICLCFPDLYETGFANMGVGILYHIINAREDAYAERAYAPDQDLADLLRRKQWPFFSLESKTPLAQFDMVGFSLPYELCYTNILEMLDLSGIPLHAEERTKDHPLIIGGGPCAVNPEPLADFFDAIVLGDGEEIIGEIIELVRAYKFSNQTRQDLLRRLSGIHGLYIPSLYDIQYNEDGVIKKITPKFSEIPETIPYRKSEIKNKEFFFPTAPVVPFVQTVHDRLNVEIQRGCPWRCRFCQAGFTYNTYRERTKSELINLVEEGLRQTGYDAITLAGLSAADHTEIIPLLQELSDRLTPKRIAIGLPSTRADRFTLALAEILQTVRRQSLTFAPEAGTERLRRVIRKELQESEIRATLKLSHQHGWKSVKLYFMYGLPTETQSDLQGIVDLVHQSKKENPGLSLTITLSPFVPKPHTPYQWHPQDRLETHREKLSFLRKHLPAQIRAHGLEQIVVEGVLARGDRRCSELLETAWRMGAKFDEWSEHFKFDLWLKAFEQTGLNPEFFSHRSKEPSETLPWHHLHGGPDKRALWNDYQTALRQSQEPVPEAPHLKFRPEVPSAPMVPAQTIHHQIERTVQRLRFKIGRQGAVRFLSHLEQIEMIRRTLRRAGLPVAYTSGFHPQMKCSFGPAISVGYESQCEYFDIDLASRVELEQVQTSFASQLPRGFYLVKASRIPLFFPSLESLINRVDYLVKVPGELVYGSNEEDLQRSLKEFLRYPDLSLEKTKKTKKGPKLVSIPLKPLIIKMEWVQEGERDWSLALSMKFGPGHNVKPERIAGLYLHLSEESVRSVKVVRKAFYVEKQDGSIVEP